MFVEVRIVILSLWVWFVMSKGQVGYFYLRFIYLGYGPYKKSKNILESSYESSCCLRRATLPFFFFFLLRSAPRLLQHCSVFQLRFTLSSTNVLGKKNKSNILWFGEWISDSQIQIIFWYFPLLVSSHTLYFWRIYSMI